MRRWSDHLQAQLLTGLLDIAYRNIGEVIDVLESFLGD